MRTEATHVICCPTSEHDGKRIRVISDFGYDEDADSYDRSRVEVEMIDTGVCGSIERRYLSEVQ
ncbi:hypothetical protein [Burkholderia vietnamiensis]|uniref:hypothetical protein n=1 Tax=Burkholderia vietnamiensis TaxID=60552 RepID=UPI0007596850|nr:hypothetical protein [Burkholderia vietnamiensis]KVR99068.1 hypothetical protein WK29_30445 [Burkholderia vietnamiensis]HDR8930513.1 hypothetical protein [Burkholderia vietnamiensis]